MFPVELGLVLDLIGSEKAPLGVPWSSGFWQGDQGRRQGSMRFSAWIKAVQSWVPWGSLPMWGYGYGVGILIPNENEACTLHVMCQVVCLLSLGHSCAPGVVFQVSLVSFGLPWAPWTRAEYPNVFIG